MSPVYTLSPAYKNYGHFTIRWTRTTDAGEARLLKKPGFLPLCEYAITISPHLLYTAGIVPLMGADQGPVSPLWFVQRSM